jgi:hypothetical protein
LLVDRKKDSLLTVIEKITLIPENKLVYIEPVQQGNMNYPKVTGIISLADVFSMITP